MFSKLKFTLSVGVTLVVWLHLTGCTKEKLFTQLPAGQTGITFANTVTESDTLNPLEFPNVYNGGGVSAGDFNGDGRLDLYFTGNMVSNALYLNKGDWTFTDVTKAAQAEGKGRWNAGAAVVDINADGRLDLYVCAGLKTNPEERRNLLYVNQGNDAQGVPHFRDMADAYGLADTSSTTNAAFFDYDNDGDLDVYMTVDYIIPGVRPNKYHTKITDGSAPSTDRLYRNDFDPKTGHPVFTNVSKQAGITIEGYGLGLNICDINNDGWKDILVTNDFIANDLLWVNNHDGTFTNRARDAFKHTSFTAMGNDVVDLNNDGHPEVVAMDMMADDYARRIQMEQPYVSNFYRIYKEFDYEHQYKRNTLQLNLGPRPDGSRPGKNSAGSDSTRNLPVFSEISYQAGIAYTDWSWTPLCFDADQDGYRDLIVTNGYIRDLSDNDFLAFQNGSGSGLSTLALTKQMPQIKIPNYAFRNRALAETGALGFEDVSDAWGINQPSYSHSAVYGDFDNDGDLDFVVNNLNEPAFVYRNNRVEQGTDEHHFLTVKLNGTRQNPQGFGSRVQIRYETVPGTGPQQQQVYELTPYRGYLSCQQAVAHFGLGRTARVAEVIVTWPDGTVSRQRNVPVNQTLTIDQTSARHEPAPASPATQPLLTDVTSAVGLAYQHDEAEFNDFDFQSLLPHKLSQYGPKLAVGDVNGDGLDDVFVTASSKVPAAFFIQTAGDETGASTFKRRDMPPLLPDENGRVPEQSACVLFDADADKDLDLFVGVSGYERIPYSPFLPSQLYINDGRGNFAIAPQALPDVKGIFSCAKAADFDRDGDLDLFVGGRVRPNFYPKPASSFLLRNDSKSGQIRFTDVTERVAPGLIDVGMVCDAFWTDPNNNGWPDLLLAGEFMPLTLFKNEAGQFKTERKRTITENGSWNALTEADLDGDGDMDYVAGNMGQNNMAQPTPDEPMRLYAGDLNSDGRYDVFPTCYYQRTLTKPERANPGRSEFAMFNRDDMIKQYIPFRKRFLSYTDYGKATMNEVLTQEERERATVLSVTYPATAWIENKGNGDFAPHPLPALAQSAPVFGIDVRDVNGDRKPDILLVGNDHGNNYIEGRQDALSGLVLLGDGKGNFQPTMPAQSGFYVPGDAKSLVHIQLAGKQDAWLTTENQGPVRVFRSGNSQKQLVNSM